MFYRKDGYLIFVPLNQCSLPEIVNAMNIKLDKKIVEFKIKFITLHLA